MASVKEMLKSGQTVVGTTATVGSDMNFLGDSGYDFILFDTQHSPVDVKQLIPTVAGLKGKSATPFIRVSDNRPDLICFALDAGARGIIVPMVNTAEQAERMVSYCRYDKIGRASCRERVCQYV